MKVFILKIKNFWVRISCLLIVLKKPITAALSFYHFSDKLLHVQLRSTGGGYSSYMEEQRDYIFLSQVLCT